MNTQTVPTAVQPTGRAPAIFVSHGAPSLPLQDTPARAFLEALGPALPRPKAILVISAHWETDEPTLNAVAVNETIHDFYGFPQALYDMRYPAPGSAALAEHTAQLLRAAGFSPAIDTVRGLDHGAWVPLLLMFPAADIPVVQLSVQPHKGIDHHLRLGQAVAALRDEGVLVIGSGAFTHNLRELDRRGPAAPESEWSQAFADWMTTALDDNRIEDLVRYRQLAPSAARAHPTEEHLLPLYVALGAGGPDAHAQRLHASAEFGSLRMDAFAFDGDKTSILKAA
jgi:4,5-DOPA dioxygenase extradiol